MHRWTNVLVFTVLCALHGALAESELIYEIIEERDPVDGNGNPSLMPGLVFEKRDFDGSMPGVLRFGKRRLWDEDRKSAVQKKEVPGVLRFGKRSTFLNEKKSMPGVLRFGKRGLSEKREIPGVLRFGKRADLEDYLQKRNDMPGVLRFGKRDVPGVLRFGKRSEVVFDDDTGNLLLKKSFLKSFENLLPELHAIPYLCEESSTWFHLCYPWKLYLLQYLSPCTLQ
ncbi:unnamed protein product [Caenorhabditis auriculariae]|uniref:Uncharacterized protein n=1 Tax=Caenorhabditis auriculariae TaxID=2777116 RepID=A0A8S1GUJ2_9PELO|nr:unnamed protein product [Caenorhabditis auriculariae]